MFIKNIIRTLSRQVLGVIMGLAISIIIARYLGPAGQGVYSGLILIPSMLYTFLNLGIGTSTVYFKGSGHFSDNIIYSNNRYFSMFIISLVSLVYLVFIWVNPYNYENDVICFHILNIVLFGLFILNDYSLSIVQSTEDFVIYNRILFLKQFINLILCIILLIVLDFGIIGAVISLFSGMLFQQLYLFKIKKPNKFVSLNLKYIRKSLKYGVKANLSNIFTFLNYRLSILLILFFLDPFYLGLFVVAQTIGEKLWIPSQSIATVLFPAITKDNLQNDKETITLILMQISIFITSIVCLLIYLTSDNMLVLLFGDEYKDSIEIINIFLVGIIAFSGDKILSVLFSGDGKPGVNLIASSLSFICNLILCLILIPKLGVKGAAIAATVTYITSFFFKILKLHQIYKVPFKKIFIPNKMYYRKLVYLFRR